MSMVTNEHIQTQFFNIIVQIQEIFQIEGFFGCALLENLTFFLTLTFWALYVECNQCGEEKTVMDLAWNWSTS